MKKVFLLTLAGALVFFINGDRFNYSHEDAQDSIDECITG